MSGTFIAQTLWDLLTGRAARKNGSRRGGQLNGVAKKRPTRRAKPQAAGAVGAAVGATMQDRYDALVKEMKTTYDVRVRKWRKSSSGVAFLMRYRDGRVTKYIEAPYPRGPMSCAIFMHEIGHHAIGLGVHKPRCLEEYVVWQWALEQMRARGFNVTEAVERRVERSMKYAVGKAMRRGIKDLPEALRRYAG